jgi:hypothetical protein
MKCADVEIMICEYVDGALAAGERAPEREQVERHLAECASCAAMVRDAADAVGFMQRADAVEPPQELISRILFDTPWHKQRTGWWAKLAYPLLQPRFAMSMALTVLTIAMIMPKMRQFQPADLSPAAVWAGIEGHVERIWERTEKLYDNLKFVYQIRATLREWQQESAIGSRSEKSPSQQRQAGPEAPAAKQ